MNLMEIDRNDIEAARRYHEEHAPLSDEEVHVLLMLQDDPKELLRVMREENWRTRSTR